MRRVTWKVRRVALMAAIFALVLPAAAQARPATSAKDGRPNILVVMTDNQATADLKHMPNVKRLLARQGATFADAVDSFPLCCPLARPSSPVSTPTTTRSWATSGPSAGTG